VKRAAPIARRTALQRRKVPLGCLPKAGVRVGGGMPRTGFPPTVVAAAMARSGGCCELCGVSLGGERGIDFSVHHRRPRGIGGSSDPVTSSVSNVLVICGSGTTGCHGRVEQYRQIAMQAGWLVRQGQDPATTPVQIFVGCRMARVLLTSDGTYGEVSG
jgi:hypothetical protein